MTKKTFGQQVLHEAEKQQKYPLSQECGETAEMIWKDWIIKMDKMVSKARKTHVYQKLWLVVHEFPVMPDLDNAMQVKIFLRDTEPTPSPCTYVFSHSPMDDDVKFEYCLPAEGLMDFILEHEKKKPGSHHPNVLKHIQWYKRELKRKEEEHAKMVRGTKAVPCDGPPEG